MRFFTAIAATIVFLSYHPTPAAPPAETPLPPPDRTPTLFLDQAGFHSSINALAFGSDGALYVGGFDKIVQRYAWKNGDFVEQSPFRLPLGPGNAGTVNCVAVSPDGKWVAVAGRAPMRGESHTGQDDAMVFETRGLPAAMKRDYGVVYLFNTADRQQCKVLRGMEAGVRVAAFADPSPESGPVLFACGVEWNSEGKQSGVIRAFQVVSGKEIAARTDLPVSATRPGLAAWSSEKNKLQCAVAWPKSDGGPGSLILWDVEAKKDSTFPDGKGNLSLAAQRDKEGRVTRLISGGNIDGVGRLVIRTVGAPEKETVIKLTREAGESLFALSTATVGDDVAALVQIQPKPKNVSGRFVELRLYDSNGKVRSTFACTGAFDADQLPSMVASRDGRFLAIAGFEDHHVEVVNVESLRDGKPKARVLPGITAGFTKVSFLTDNRLWAGGSSDSPSDGGVVFEAANRKAHGNDGKSQVDVASKAVEYHFDVKSRVVTASIGKKEFSATLREDEVPTAVVYLPAAPSWDKNLPAMLAVAHRHQKASVSMTTLFEAETGKRILQLHGPAGVIRDLSIRGSGPLLAAATSDRTIWVWSLKNSTSSFAALEGIFFAEREKALTVVAVEPAVGEVLRADDVVEAAGGEKGDLKPVETHTDLIRIIRELPIGGEARLKLKGKGIKKLKVGRAIGQRNPLFTLWIDPVEKKKEFAWVGWSPSGPYDVDSPDSESRLGWLSTTGDPKEPVRYAWAEQYRKAYYRSGFLKLLCETADFGEALEKYVSHHPRSAPILTIYAEGAEEDRDGVLFVSHKPESLQILIHDPERVIGSDQTLVRCRFIRKDGTASEWKEFPLKDGATIDIRDQDWTRGVLRCEAELRETKDLPAVLFAKAAFRHQPPAPKLSVLVEGKAITPGSEFVTEKPEIELIAQAESSVEAAISLETSGPNGVKTIELKTGRPTTLKLNRESKTALRVKAVNNGAEEFVERETTFVDLVVRHQPPKPKPAPRVRLSLDSAGETPKSAGGPLISTSRTIAFKAVIEAENPIGKVEWNAGEAGWNAIETKSDDAKKIELKRDYEFPLGGKPTRFSIRAATKDGLSSTDSVDVVWAALPQVDFADVPNSTESDSIRLKIVCGPTEKLAPFTMTLEHVIEGVGTLGTQTLPRNSDFVEIRPRPGTNRFRLNLSNDWTSSRSPIREIRRLRPPMVASVGPIALSEHGEGSIKATVLSPVGISPDKLLLNGLEVETSWEGPGFQFFGWNMWRMHAEGIRLVPPSAGKGKAKVVVRSMEGISREVQTDVIPAPPPPPPPVVRLLGPELAEIGDGANIRTDRGRFPISLRIASQTPLTSAEVLREDGGRRVGEHRIDPNSAKSSTDGFVAEKTFELSLREGVNLYEVRASAGAGTRSKKFSVSYTPPPVRVVVDTVEQVDSEGRTHALELDGDKPIETGSAQLRVSGRVLWADPDDVVRGGGFEAVLVANHVRHLPVELTPPKAGEKTSNFTAPVFLNSETNHVVVEVRRRGSRIEAPKSSSDASLTLNCKNPLREQRLHVVVIAPEREEDSRGVIAREVVGAVGGELAGNREGYDRGSFKHKAFREAVLYRPLVDNVGRANIVGLLRDVDSEIRRTADRPGDKGWVNDVVLIYYQGRDLIGKDGVRRLHTTRSLQYAEGAADAHAVRIDELPPTPGVRLFLLNVVAPTPPGGPLDRVVSGPPTLCYVWKEQTGSAKLLSIYKNAISQKPTIGEVVDNVRQVLEQGSVPTVLPLEEIPSDIRARPIGTLQRQ